MSESYFAPSLFVNHGGGPNPVLGVESDREMANALRNVCQLIKLDQLKAIIVVTAHREEDCVVISASEHHDMLYDYSNFPPETYTYKHNAPGDPVLARKIHSAFQEAGIKSVLDHNRGWDHGVFIPMMLIDPAAKIPIIQVSILRNQNAREHFDIGKVLYKFREDGIAILGSGMSFHNMKMFRQTRVENDGVIVNEMFDKFLNEVCTGKEDKERMLEWEKAPQALDCQPLRDADHLMPLIVCLGASGPHNGKNVFASLFKRKFLLSGFMWDKDF
ncbi:uncharacterized protein [Epargyreus clarus]|uniref:uncharacterized protein n=1 Tax=Epargyreus clarus TaxID=520877 RepID=UPI003C2B4918